MAKIVHRRTYIPLEDKTNPLASDEWMDEHFDEATGNRVAASRRLITIWERCRVCADQMYGGPRCLEHNPTPEMRELNSGVTLIQARWWDATPSGT